MRYFLLLALTTMVSFAAVQPFSLKEMKSGEIYNSADHAGSVFVFESYFLDCPYCNQNAPNVDELAASYMGDGRVQVLDIGVDRNDAQYAEWIRRHSPNHPVLNDGARTLTKQLGTSRYPTVFVVDKTGTILFQATGVWSGATKARIRHLVDSALLQAPLQMDEKDEVSDNEMCLP